ncbi:hypothetical protein HU200_062982 [Digitaria exilis]|uniref:Uncharacterized protein n=1 Tax=Digitaria exilis TaxID=1010633 RepID=A0A835AC12_9POAL|nr:hypothetical protein HU200_062982 [Digitaria exilis]
MEILGQGSVLIKFCISYPIHWGSSGS